MRWRAVSSQIRRAFKNTPRPDDAELFDGYPNLHPEERDILEYLRGKTWKQVHDFEECGLAILFLSVAGWRYFLPAWLMNATAVPATGTGFSFPLTEYLLWPRGQLRQDSLARIDSLSRNEFDAVRAYVKFASEIDGGGAMQAWQEFWEKASFGNLPDIV